MSIVEPAERRNFEVGDRSELSAGFCAVVAPPVLPGTSALLRWGRAVDTSVKVGSAKFTISLSSHEMEVEKNLQQ